MKFYDCSFFSKSGKIKVHFLRIDPAYEVCLSINASENKYYSPAIHLYLKNEIEFINFKNSVLWEFEEYKRVKGEENE